MSGNVADDDGALDLTEVTDVTLDRRYCGQFICDYSSPIPHYFNVAKSKLHACNLLLRRSFYIEAYFRGHCKTQRLFFGNSFWNFRKWLLIVLTVPQSLIYRNKCKVPERCPKT